MSAARILYTERKWSWRRTTSAGGVKLQCSTRLHPEGNKKEKMLWQVFIEECKFFLVVLIFFDGSKYPKFVIKYKSLDFLLRTFDIYLN